MFNQIDSPRVFRILERDALAIHSSSTGDVGQLFRGEGIEAVWVSKQAEEVDREWFSQPVVDLILVVQGELRVEFENPTFDALTLQAGDLFILPPTTRCRAYRWPRDDREPTIFFAAYPVEHQIT